jgi:hypothetical protein
MGVVIDFPKDRAAYRVQDAVSADGHCEVVILPVIRIDRYEDKPVLGPTGGRIAGGRRRRRMSRS